MFKWQGRCNSWYSTESSSYLTMQKFHILIWGRMPDKNDKCVQTCCWAVLVASQFVFIHCFCACLVMYRARTVLFLGVACCVRCQRIEPVCGIAMTSGHWFSRVSCWKWYLLGNIPEVSSSQQQFPFLNYQCHSSATWRTMVLYSGSHATIAYVITNTLVWLFALNVPCSSFWLVFWTVQLRMCCGLQQIRSELRRVNFVSKITLNMLWDLHRTWTEIDDIA